MSRLIRSAVRALNPVLRPLGRNLLNLHNVPRRLDTLDAAVRMTASHHLRAEYAALLPESEPHSPINHHEYRAYSQHGEDGILLYIYGKIGLTNRRFVEFGVEDGTECNAANLAINFGFSGLLMDGDESNIERGRRFYRATLGDAASRVTLAQSWVTAENINEIIQSRGFEGEIDLLSIDIDGNDYWVWKAIDVVQPRVLVLEYNAALGAERSLAIPYNPAFDRLAAHPSGFYYGASLAAYSKLCAERGFSLVGCESRGVNAFFVRDDVNQRQLEVMKPADAFYAKASSVRQGFSTEEQFDQVRHLPFVDI